MDSEDSQKELGTCWRRVVLVGEISVEGGAKCFKRTAPSYFLHVWLPEGLLQHRAAIAASLLPENADRQRFLSLQGIPPETDVVIYQEFLRAKAEKEDRQRFLMDSRISVYRPLMTQSLAMAKRAADSSLFSSFSGKHPLNDTIGSQMSCQWPPTVSHALPQRDRKYPAVCFDCRDPRSAKVPGSEGRTGRVLPYESHEEAIAYLWRDVLIVAL